MNKNGLVRIYLRFRQTGAWLTIYMPVAIMLLLVLGSFWLIKNTKPWQEPLFEELPSADPDYKIKGLALQSFDANGVLQKELRANSILRYEDSGIGDLEGPVLYALQTGSRLNAFAKRARINADGTEIQLIGSAQVEYQPSNDQNGGETTTLSGDFLHFYLDEERLSSNKPISVVQGKNQFSANAIALDQLRGTMVLSGRVRASLIPGSGFSN